MSDRLFVYGTLRSDIPWGAFLMIRDRVRFQTRARVRGRLFHLGRYPGYVAEPAGAWVHGEVYRLTNPDETLLLLDEYEGCGPGSVEPYEFERVRMNVLDEEGRPLAAWVYIYRYSTAGRREIRSGDYAEAVTERK